MICDRCGKVTVGWKTSWFNLDTICMDCIEEEENHPDFQEAKRVVKEQERLGNFNYEGIGWRK